MTEVCRWSWLVLWWGACLSTAAAAADDPWWVTYAGVAGPGAGKHVVLVSGDEEYRSEEALPQLGRILAVHHGFQCTVLFAIDPATGQIDPNRNDNIPGLEALEQADLLVIATRFRNLPDEQMKHLANYVQSGRPVIGLRTATHAFNLDAKSAFAEYTWTSKSWDGGFGRQVLGETWINHHGEHGRQSTRGLLAPAQSGHPILRGLADADIWGPTDVYAVRLPLPGDCLPLVLGQVVAGMQASDPAAEGPKNNPLMPVAWTHTYTTQRGQAARVFTTTMGAATDLVSPGLRRLLVNACYWAVGLEAAIAPHANVDLVGHYEPTPFGFGSFKKGVRPHDLRWPE